MTTVDLPSAPKIAGGEFFLRQQVGTNPLIGGGYQGASVGEALWYARVETTALSRAQAGEYAWLFANRRGALRALYIFDASRPRPLAYHSAAWLDAPTCDSTLVTCDVAWITVDAEGDGVIAPWGTPRVVAVDGDAGTVDLEGFYPGATISQGDYGAWDDGAARRLHITDAGTAGADGTLTLSVEPPPPASSSALPAAFFMEKASAEMLLLNTALRFSAPVVSRGSFEAIQVLRSE